MGMMGCSIACMNVLSNFFEFRISPFDYSSSSLVRIGPVAPLHLLFIFSCRL